ncbi:MAG: malto-oligosyltrehalose synthase [Rhodoferax sp.]|nr:malto-oligosyltrehalose synthase [Rhodoferax sp.]
MRPNTAYEDALLLFVRGVLGRSTGNPLWTELRSRATELAWFGALNSFTMALLKFTSPGVPDIYQGNEVIDLSLVDPDNRRPVDYAARSQLLDGLQPLVDAPRNVEVLARLSQLAAQPTDGHLKLWTTWRLLELRKKDPALFQDGDYVPLRVHGSARDHVVAYARRTPTSLLIVVATRLYARLLGHPGVPAVGAACWGDTAIDLAPLLQRPLQLHDVLSGASHTVNLPRSASEGQLRLADVLTELPGAALYSGPAG